MHRFQYVSCEIDILQHLKAPHEIEKALGKFPNGLDATYDRILLGVEEGRQKQIASVLKWLAFSLRPLFLEEVAEIFILDHEPFDETKRLFKADAVLGYLPSLVTKTTKYAGSRVEISLAHFSIKEYLISSRISQGPAANFLTTEMGAHLHIAESCLAYHIQLSKTELATEENVRGFPLWRYAVKYWNRHLDISQPLERNTSVANQALQFFTPGTQHLLNMIRIRDPDNDLKPAWEKQAEDIALPLYYAASLGALQLSQILIEASSSSIIDEFSPKGKFGTALQAAACWGHRTVTSLLLSKGANANAQGGRLGNALQAAAYMGSKDIMQLLLDKGADINAENEVCGNALIAGLFGEEGEDIAQFLLDRGANATAKGGFLGGALQVAAYMGRKDIVQLLIVRGANITVKGGIFGNALQAAVANDELDIVELFFSCGAKADPPGPEWEELLVNLREKSGGKEVDRLRKFQENPTSWMVERRQRGKRTGTGWFQARKSPHTLWDKD